MKESPIWNILSSMSGYFLRWKISALREERVIDHIRQHGGGDSKTQLLQRFLKESSSSVKWNGHWDEEAEPRAFLYDNDTSVCVSQVHHSEGCLTDGSSHAPSSTSDDCGKENHWGRSAQIVAFENWKMDMITRGISPVLREGVVTIFGMVQSLRLQIDVKIMTWWWTGRVEWFRGKAQDSTPARFKDRWMSDPSGPKTVDHRVEAQYLPT